MTAIEPSQARKRVIRIPVGLLLSIGSEKPERGPGRPIDHFRPKEGELGQFAKEAARFSEHYGAEPKELTDLYFLFDSVPAVLDIRLLAFSQSGIRGVGGTNFAEIMDDTDFEARVWGEHAFKDSFTFFPKDVTEIRPELREAWEGEPIEGNLEGRSDPRVARLEVKVVASLEFCLPEIMGLGKVARISTSGRASIRNLWKALWTEYEAFGYRLSGIPFRLALRPRPTQRFDAEKKAYIRTTVFELVIDTTHTVGELQAALEQHRKAFGGIPSRERLAVEGRAMSQALALPRAGEEERTREEVDATLPDALLNKLAALEKAVGEEASLLMLRGVFGVEAAVELDPEQAERYWQMLERALPAEEVEGEVVEDSAEGPEGEPGSQPAPQKDSAGGPSDGASEGADGSEGKRHESPSAEEDSGAVVDRRAEGDAGGDVGGTGSPVRSDAAPEPLPGEPVTIEGLMDPVDVAAELVIPIGSNRGKMILGDAPDTWIEYALRNERYFKGHETFYAGLELYARNRRAELWERIRGGS